MTAQSGRRPPLHEGGTTTLPNTKVPNRTPEEEQAAREAAVEAQLQVWRQYLPWIFKKLTQISDLRRVGSVRHRIAVVLFYGLLLFVFQYASRREANRNATSPTLLAALHEVFPDITTVPHFDTVERPSAEYPRILIKAALKKTKFAAKSTSKYPSWISSKIVR